MLSVGALMREASPPPALRGRTETARILAVQARLEPHGGGPAVASWLLQALARDHEITVLSWKDLDLAGVNEHYGTTLSTADFRVISARRFLRRIVALDPDPCSIQPNMLLMRIARRLRSDYDLVVSPEMESDLGGGAIQYVHHPWLERQYERTGRDRHRRPWRLVGGYSFDRMKQNLTLTNSDWTGRWLNRLYGIDSLTVYPPAPGEFPAINWQDREPGFLCIGRFHPEKRQLEVIEILRALRVTHAEVKLHLVGTAERGQTAWYEQLRALGRANSDWITIHENLSRDALIALASRQRYGIHARVDEHFGIGVAEMLRAGCIPFVHGSGGQLEIVGGDERVTFTDAADAVGKIQAVLSSELTQHHVRTSLAQRAELFTTEAFTRRIRQLTSAWLERRRNAACSVLAAT